MLARISYYILGFTLLLGATALTVRVVYPQQSQEFWWDARKVWHEFMYGKDFNYYGLSVLDSEDIEVHLPIDGSVFWWHLNTPTIEGAIRAHPLVQDARVQSCRKFSIRCFDIFIVERKPQYLIQLGSQHWLVGTDGGFITPAPNSEELPNLITITGIGDAQTSPDIVRARLTQLQQAILSIEKLSGLSVKSIDFADTLEFAVTFRGVPFETRFDLSNGGELVSKEATRLKKLLGDFAGRLDQVRSINLAFNKLAVVQVNQDLPAAEPTVKAHAKH